MAGGLNYDIIGRRKKKEERKKRCTPLSPVNNAFLNFLRKLLF
jgi:hypothetical protein